MIDESHPDVSAQADLEDAIGGRAKDEPPRPNVGESITEAEIHAWCQWFADQGVEASARSIRKERGGKGSPEGIHAHVLTWRAKRDGAQAKAAEAPKTETKDTGSREVRTVTALRRAAPALETLTEAILADINDAVAAVQDEAIRDVRAIKLDADRQIAEIRAGSEATIASLRNDHAKAVAVMQSDLDGALAEAQDAIDRADALDQSISGEAGYLAQIAGKDSEIKALKAEIERLRPFEASAAGLETALNELGTKYADLEQDLADAQAEAATQKADADKQRGIADGLRSDLDQARRDLSNASQTAATAAGKAAGLEQALEAIKTVAADREAEIARLSADLTRVRSERDARAVSQPPAPQAADAAPGKTRRKRTDTAEQGAAPEATP